MKLEFILGKAFDLVYRFHKLPCGAENRVRTLGLPEQHVEPLVVSVDVADLNPGVTVPFDQVCSLPEVT
jgi:hypothetical protein